MTPGVESSASGHPLVSVIVCTRDRPAMLAGALESVFAQTWPQFEVIVVDDGLEVPVSLPPEVATRVRLVTTRRGCVGLARAAGLEAARGSFVAYCDDDDTWAPEHLSTLASFLQDHPPVDLVYADSEWLVGDKAPHVAFSFDYEETTLAGKNYIFASDVMHRAAAARAVGSFDPTLELHEDWDLWLRMTALRPPHHLSTALGTHRWHAGCASNTKRLEQWQRVYDAHQKRLAPAGAGQRPPFDRATWQPGRRELIWHSAFAAETGHGSLARSLLRQLESEGIDLVMSPRVSGLDYPAELERPMRPWDGWGKLGFYYHRELRPTRMRCEKLVNYSMWESTRVPPSHVEEINAAASLQYVACRQNAEAFRDCGVRVPIKLLHPGVDAQRFPVLERHHTGGFTFGSVGDLICRKGVDVLIRAFLEEFSPREPVRLLLKTLAGTGGLPLGDPRIVVTGARWDHERLLEYLGELDAFVLPSRGEGFGLCGLEAMATGLPLIATNWSGPTEYLDEGDSFPLAYRLADPQKNPLHLRETNWMRFHGLWAEPDHEHLRHLMRWLYEHPAEAATKGLHAAQRVRESFTWARAARQVVADLTELAEGGGR
ncbi:MAG: glycosyltransferase [Candidatus Riflebacteria bacterium]|nr:glycosyltransferase [Candidatus Riflebacteria bacterium]